MSDLKNLLIRLGTTKPELREHIRPVLAKLEPRTAGPKIPGSGSFRDLKMAFLKSLGEAYKKRMESGLHDAVTGLVVSDYKSRVRVDVETEEGYYSVLFHIIKDQVIVEDVSNVGGVMAFDSNKSLDAIAKAVSRDILSKFENLGSMRFSD